MKKICVFCGARSGARPTYVAAARAFGRLLADRGLGLVYGGGRVGLMGELAQAALDHGGYVTGVIPSFLSQRELQHPGIHTCHVVTDLMERKAMMMEIADAFVALPGGIGTLDEVLEVMAWRGLKRLDKPIAFFNVDDFFEPWRTTLGYLDQEGFVDSAELGKLVYEAEPERLLERLGFGQVR
jgi:hypothetical protein